MDLFPILKTLKRHKTAAGLIVLQLALTCTIVCNALFLIMQRVEQINEPSGLVDEELVVISLNGVAPSQNPEAQTREDLAALRAIPGVKSVSVLNQVPFGGQLSMSTVRLSEDNNSGGPSAVDYHVGEGALNTLGLKLVQGRDFESSEYLDLATLRNDDNARVPAIIISKSLAARLFPDGNALGQQVYGMGGSGASRIVGVVDTLISTQPGGREEFNRYSMLQPVRYTFRNGQYMVRCAPQDRERILKAGVAALDRVGPGRILRQQQLFTESRSQYYAADRNMALLLVGVCVALMVVTAFGIVGLASFWVQQRTRMIGTRRALGATRGQILRYFQTENLLLSAVGALLGVLGAAGLSLLLVRQYELPGLPWHYLPIGAALLCLLGQLAVLAPARRAAALPPVAALRS